MTARADRAPTETAGARPPSRACCSTTPRSGPTRRRCARRTSASGRRSTWAAAGGAGARSWPAAWPQAGLQRGEHLVVIGENRPRLYASMLAAQSLGAMPVPLYQDAAAAEFVFPINNAEVALRDRRRPGAGRQAARDARRSARSSRASGTTTRAACATTTSRGWRRSTRCSRPARALRRARTPASSTPRSRKAEPARRRRRCSSPRAPPATRRAWCTPTSRCSTAPRAGARVRQADRATRRCWPTCRWPGSARTSSATRSGWPAATSSTAPSRPTTVMIDMREIGPTYYFAPPRIFEGLLTSVTIRMEDASRAQALAVPALHGRWRAASARRSWTASRSALLDRLQLRARQPARSTARCATRSACRACAWPTPPARRSGPTCSRFYRSIGINLKQLYGSTETAVFVCLQPDDEVQAPTRWACRSTASRSARRLAARSWCARPGLLKRVLQEPGGHRRGEGRRRLVPHRRRRLHRRRRPPEDHRPRQGRRPHHGGSTTARCSRPSTSRTSSSSSRTSRRRWPSATSASEVCAFINIDFEAVGNWAERRGLPYAGYTDLAQQARGARADPRLRREGQRRPRRRRRSSPAARSTAS